MSVVMLSLKICKKTSITFNQGCSDLGLSLNKLLYYRSDNNTYVESTFKGRDRIDDTDPVKSVLYIRHAVSGTTPSHANATIV